MGALSQSYVGNTSALPDNEGIYKTIVSKVALIAGTCDLPVKCLVFNFRQLNGFYGCPKCLQPGKPLTLG